MIHMRVGVAGLIMVVVDMVVVVGLITALEVGGSTMAAADMAVAVMAGVVAGLALLALLEAVLALVN
jgi:hypothetical protein